MIDLGMLELSYQPQTLHNNHFIVLNYICSFATHITASPSIHNDAKNAINQIYH